MQKIFPNFLTGSRTYIMGILNVTPDSFSDGGKYTVPEKALEQAKRMLEEGADILDIGGESTRPGSLPVDEATELQRVVPVVELLHQNKIGPLSVDTRKSAVAEAALKAGADIINDVDGLQRDPHMAPVIAEHGAGVIIMHNPVKPILDNLFDHIFRYFERSIKIATKAGIDRNSIVLDPGIGFGKTQEQNWEILRHFERFKELGFPLLLGASRKSFIGHLLDLPNPLDRIPGTLATSVIGIAKGADFIRVHDIRANREVAKIADYCYRRQSANN